MSAKPRPDRYALDYRLFDHLPRAAGPDLVALSGNETRAEHPEFGCWSMVPLATVFPTEPRHFAPWFESRRLAELGRLLRRRLTSPSSERAAGPGFIDTLAVDAVTRFYVGIEYQSAPATTATSVVFGPTSTAPRGWAFSSPSESRSHTYSSPIGDSSS